MNSRLWVRFFLISLVVGAVSTIVSGLVVRWDQFGEYFIQWDTVEVLAIMVWLIGVGLIFSVISQMGFFAYITFHRLALGLFRGNKLWNYVQVILIFVAIIDFVYLRNKFEPGILLYLGLAIVIVAVSALVAIKKANETDSRALIPTLFFMIVITIVEWIPALQVKENTWLLTMLFPLLICNAHQILTLHKINQKAEEIKKIKMSS